MCRMQVLLVYRWFYLAWELLFPFLFSRSVLPYRADVDRVRSSVRSRIGEVESSSHMILQATSTRYWIRWQRELSRATFQCTESIALQKACPNNLDNQNFSTSSGDQQILFLWYKHILVLIGTIT
ncbi:hypothetical protein B9Z19DRAFT_1081591 [Tuber borchii]|uniref:Uncharacterized protein n=1 Tax=Tuber borchii TaxID=42251 RepID=A0A2T6ZVJ6_TUBBO|nr:hypothetical protein B9Z19DRAFT_1081591 [Tuber borchii]